MSRSPLSTPYPILVSLAVAGAIALLLVIQPPKPILSNWGIQDNVAEAISGSAAQQAPVAPAVPQASTPITGVAKAQGIGQVALDAYLQDSVLEESVGEGSVGFFRREIAGGTLDFFIVRLDERSHVEVINADGATPGSDPQGDTIWTDGQRHLATVQAMAGSGYAARDSMELLGAMAFGFHGEPRTANEGTVVINGQVLRSNPGRSTLCITHERHAEIGTFSTEDLGRCAQAIGGGPVILWENKIVNPAVGATDGEFLPFNPLGEDFVQLDWRKQIYNGLYPKTVVGIGLLEGGESYLVLATSHNMTGVDLARQLRDLGCYAALGGDDDTSTQAVWRGTPVRPGNPRAVPDAIGVYLKQ